MVEDGQQPDEPGAGTRSLTVEGESGHRCSWSQMGMMMPKECRLGQARGVTCVWGEANDG